MAYTPNTWVARAGTGLNRFSYVMDGDYIYLTPAPVSVQDPGTPFSVDWMNNIEQGITDAQNPDSLSVGQTMPTGLGSGVINAAVGFAVNGISQDYIVDAGTSDNWNYRKWASGIYECWRNYEVSDIAIDTAWGGIYYGYVEGVDFPITFIDLPVMTATVNAQTTSTIFLGTGSGSSWSKFSTSQTGAFVLLRGTSGTFSGIISIHAKGKWK